MQLAFDGAKKISIFNAQDEYLENAKSIIQKLAKEVPNCTAVVYNLENTDKLKEEIESADILVNTTIIGMKPYHEETLVPKELLRKDLVVADTVYNPEKTRLILEAEEMGCAKAFD